MLNESDHTDHDVVPFAEAHDTKLPRIHAGIDWCIDCATEVVPDEQPARVI